MNRATWQQAYDAQMGLWRWYRTPQGMGWMAAGLSVNSQSLQSSTAMMLKGLYRSEETKVLNADPLFVSAEMVDLVEAAAETFEPEPLIASDVIVRDGFLWFERPIMILDRFDEPMPLRGFSWCPMFTSEADQPSSVELDDDEAGRTAVILYGNDELEEQMSGIALTIYSDVEHPAAPLGFVPCHLTPWWHNMTFDGNEVAEDGEPSGAGWWWKILQTSLRLMQQRIAVRHQERPWRPSRREAMRLGFVDRDVLVVRLRREQSKSHHDEPQGEANYSHRFIVGGHWRNQWYPSGQVHRQIWISPYVKGPDDKPLVVAPNRAYTWSR